MHIKEFTDEYRLQVFQWLKLETLEATNFLNNYKV